jgi:hypothetical protein
MAMIYTGGTVVGTPSMTRNEQGTAKLVFRLRDTRQVGEKTYTEQCIVEMWGDAAEQYAQVVTDGTVVEKVKGFPRAEVGKNQEGKEYGYIVVKARELDLGYQAPEPQAAEQTVGDDDPFGDQ